MLLTDDNFCIMYDPFASEGMRSPETEHRNNNECVKSHSINDLPDEVIEFVLSFVPPYKDLHDCMLVCKRWRENVLNVVRFKRKQLHASLSNFNIQWQVVNPIEKSPTITKRYSHATVIFENSMYVFGGCTNSMTTFNDLWRLDLSKREWIRPRALGTYPTPKACSSMVKYKDSLVLFGGWAYPAAYPFHQSLQLFNELHTYNVFTNEWSYIETNNPPPMAGHSVSVHGEWMVIFGGMQRCTSTANTVRTNDVWKLNLKSLVWQKQETSKIKPNERYQHSQNVLDDEHILIMGGCGGPNGLYNDVWLLKMKGEVWKWTQVEVRGSAWAPPDTWCHPTCKVGDQIIVLNRSRGSEHAYSVKNCWRGPQNNPELVPPQNGNNQQAHAIQDRDENVNGRRGALNARKQHQEEAPSNAPASTSREHVIKIRDNPRIGLSLSAFATPSPKPVLNKNREKQIEMLRKMENFIRNKHKPAVEDQVILRQPTVKKIRKNILELYLLDTSHALDEHPYVSWQEPKNTGPRRYSGPEETLLYTLVQGKGELIMFGGIQKDNSGVDMMSTNFDPCSYSTKVSNSLHFICPPIDVI